MKLSPKERIVVFILAITGVAISINYLNEPSWPITFGAVSIVLICGGVMLKLIISFLTNKTNK